MRRWIPACQSERRDGGNEEPTIMGAKNNSTKGSLELLPSRRRIERRGRSARTVFALGAGRRPIDQPKQGPKQHAGCQANGQHHSTPLPSLFASALMVPRV